MSKEELIAVFVATHVKFDPPQNPIYIPLHVGKQGKSDLGYLGDDSGENISDLNPYYAELTGLFWIWQNIRDIDYVGFCHYRRYFINENRKVLSKTEYITLLQEYDAIVPKHAECSPDYHTHFSEAHREQDLDALGRALKRTYPDYADAYDQAMSGNVFYFGNLLVTRLDTFRSYAEWLFTILAETGEEVDPTDYDGYQRKVFGFLAEQMFYVYALKNQLKLCEVMVGISDEKAETKALIEKLRALLNEGQISEARAIFDREMKKRPDLLLPGSDIHHELGDIYEQLRCG